MSFTKPDDPLGGSSSNPNRTKNKRIASTEEFTKRSPLRQSIMSPYGGGKGTPSSFQAGVGVGNTNGSGAGNDGKVSRMRASMGVFSELMKPVLGETKNRSTIIAPDAGKSLGALGPLAGGAGDGNGISGPSAPPTGNGKKPRESSPGYNTFQYSTDGRSAKQILRESMMPKNSSEEVSDRRTSSQTRKKLAQDGRRSLAQGRASKLGASKFGGNRMSGIRFKGPFDDAALMTESGTIRGMDDAEGMQDAGDGRHDRAADKNLGVGASSSQSGRASSAHSSSRRTHSPQLAEDGEAGHERLRIENEKLRKKKLETQKELTLQIHQLKNEINSKKLENDSLLQQMSNFEKKKKALDEEKKVLEKRREKDLADLLVYRQQIHSSQYSNELERGRITELEITIAELTREKQELIRKNNLESNDYNLFEYHQAKRISDEKQAEVQNLSKEIDELNKIITDADPSNSISIGQTKQLHPTDDRDDVVGGMITGQTSTIPSMKSDSNIGFEMLRKAHTELAGLRKKIADGKRELATMQEMGQASRIHAETRDLKQQCRALYRDRLKPLSAEVAQAARAIIESSRQALEDSSTPRERSSLKSAPVAASFAQDDAQQGATTSVASSTNSRQKNLVLGLMQELIPSSLDITNSIFPAEPELLRNFSHQVTEYMDFIKTCLENGGAPGSTPPSISSTTNHENSQAYNMMDFLLNSFENATELFGDNPDLLMQDEANKTEGGAVTAAQSPTSSPAGQSGGTPSPAAGGVLLGSEKKPKPGESKKTLEEICISQSSDYLFQIIRVIYQRLSLMPIYEKKRYLVEVSGYMKLCQSFNLLLNKANEKEEGRKAFYETQLSELQKKSGALLKDWELRSGSKKALEIMTNFFLTQSAWLEKMVTIDGQDKNILMQMMKSLKEDPSGEKLITLHTKGGATNNISVTNNVGAGSSMSLGEEFGMRTSSAGEGDIPRSEAENKSDMPIASGKVPSSMVPAGSGFLGNGAGGAFPGSGGGAFAGGVVQLICDRLEQFLSDKRAKKVLRLKQVQIACVNLEKDIRHLELEKMSKDKGADYSFLDNLHIRWTATGDTSDIEVQTDSGGFVLSKTIFHGKKQVKIVDGALKNEGKDGKKGAIQDTVPDLGIFASKTRGVRGKKKPPLVTHCPSVDEGNKENLNGSTPGYTPGQLELKDKIQLAPLEETSKPKKIVISNLAGGLHGGLADRRKAQEKAQNTVCGSIVVTLISDKDILAQVKFDELPTLSFYTNVDKIRFSTRIKKKVHTNEPTRGSQTGMAGEPGNMFFSGMALGAKVADLLELETGGGALPKLRLQGQDDRQEETQKNSLELDLDCLYNDNKLYTRTIVYAGIGFVTQVLNCRTTKYGISFLHLKIHNAVCNWTRWSTCNARRFWTAMGVNSASEFTALMTKSDSSGDDSMKSLLKGEKPESKKAKAIGKAVAKKDYSSAKGSGNSQSISSFPMNSAYAATRTAAEELYDRYVLATFTNDLQATDFYARMVFLSPNFALAPLKVRGDLDKFERAALTLEQMFAPKGVDITPVRPGATSVNSIKLDVRTYFLLQQLVAEFKRAKKYGGAPVLVSLGPATQGGGTMGGNINPMGLTNLQSSRSFQNGVRSSGSFTGGGPMASATASGGPAQFGSYRGSGSGGGPQGSASLNSGNIGGAIEPLTSSSNSLAGFAGAGATTGGDSQSTLDWKGSKSTAVAVLNTKRSSYSVGSVGNSPPTQRRKKRGYLEEEFHGELQNFVEVDKFRDTQLSRCFYSITFAITADGNVNVELTEDVSHRVVYARERQASKDRRSSQQQRIQNFMETNKDDDGTVPVNRRGSQLGGTTAGRPGSRSIRRASIEQKDGSTSAGGKGSPDDLSDKKVRQSRKMDTSDMSKTPSEKDLGHSHPSKSTSGKFDKPGKMSGKTRKSMVRSSSKADIMSPLEMESMIDKSRELKKKPVHHHKAKAPTKPNVKESPRKRRASHVEGPSGRRASMVDEYGNGGGTEKHLESRPSQTNLGKKADHKKQAKQRQSVFRREGPA